MSDFVTGFLHQTVDGVVHPGEFGNRSLFHRTVGGDTFCFTYTPKGETDFSDDDAFPGIFVSLNSTGIPAWLFYVHDRTMTTLDYAGLYGGDFLFRPTFWSPGKTFDAFQEVFYVYRKEVSYINKEKFRCNETTKEIDFDGCLTRYIESQLGCTIPDWSKGEDEQLSSVCTGDATYKNYTKLRSVLSKRSEQDIFLTYGCMSKCQRVEYRTRYMSKMDISAKGAPNQLSIAFIYASGRYQVEKHSYMYGHDAFVADFGGYLGLCLGMSVLTFFDIVAWIVEKCRRGLNSEAANSDRRNKKPDKQPHSRTC